MHVIVDGYVDEPSSLGVPPYLSPEARYLYGAVKASGEDVVYLPVDALRGAGGLSGALPRRGAVRRGDLLLILVGALVPGRYLLTRPISHREVERTLKEGKRLGFETVLGGPITFAGGLEVNDLPDLLDHLPVGDLDHFAYHYLKKGVVQEVFRSDKERETFSILGAGVVEDVRIPKDMLVVELETYRGCVRYPKYCSFCMERLYGSPRFRLPKEIGMEVSELYRRGVKNFRIGGQSCIVSYGTSELESSEAPRPNPEAIRSLLTEVRESAPGLEVLHVDNANPEVIARHPCEAREALEVIRDLTTDGDVLAFGLESADPKVKEVNNLNTTPEATLEALRIVNHVGRRKGERGLPRLLAGLNFLLGLPGESETTYSLNREFLMKVRREGIWLRRINVRQVRYPVPSLSLSKYLEGVLSKPPAIKPAVKRRVREFRTWVRGYEMELMIEMFPVGSVLRRAYSEIQLHGGTYLRQPGSYPIILYAPYRMKTGRFYDVVVVGHSPRSLTVVEYPFPLKTATLRMLLSIPGVGKRRAAAIVSRRPETPEEILQVVGDREVSELLARISGF